MSVLLFDLDGTLVDSRQPILRSLNEALGSMGLGPIPDDEIARHIGPPLKLTLQDLLEERGHDTAAANTVIEAYRTAYQPLSLQLAQAYPGVLELLDRLQGACDIGVVTSKPLVYARPVLDHLGLAQRMCVIEGPGVADEEEPKSVTLARAMNRLPAAGGGVVMIGDRHHDIEAGRFHAIGTVGVTWGFGSREELESAGADRIVDDPAEIDAELLRL